MSSTTDTGEDEDQIKVTERAATEALALMTDEGIDTDAGGLRLGLVDGGCSEFSYRMRFEPEPTDRDNVFESRGLRVFVDPTNMSAVGGSVLAYEGGLQGGGFIIENPNAVSECGCGESFSTGR